MALAPRRKRPAETAAAHRDRAGAARSRLQRALVGEAAGRRPSAGGEALLAERAGEQSVFLEEALRDLVAQGALRLSDGSYQLAVRIDTLEVPLLVQELLQARLDRLAPGPQPRRYRSVHRPLVSFPLLVCSFRTIAFRLFSELQRLDLVVEERRRPVAEYRFQHGLVQEAAYNGLPEERRELHCSTRRGTRGAARGHGGRDRGPSRYHLAEGGSAKRRLDGSSAQGMQPGRHTQTSRRPRATTGQSSATTESGRHRPRAMCSSRSLSGIRQRFEFVAASAAYRAHSRGGLPVVRVAPDRDRWWCHSSRPIRTFPATRTRPTCE